MLFVFLSITVLACSGSDKSKTDSPEFSFIRSTEEIELKEQVMKEFLRENRLDAFLIEIQRNFSWITGGGDNHVVLEQMEVWQFYQSPAEKYVIALHPQMKCHEL